MPSPEGKITMQMETLLLIQTVVLFLTGLIVFFYTWETNKIRKETAKQNSILAEQLTIIRSSLEFEIKKEGSFIDPIFRWGNSSGGANEIVCNFTNKGGQSKITEIRSMGQFPMEIYPKGMIAPDENGYIKILYKPPRPKRVSFEIHYENKLNQRKSEKFFYDGSLGKVEKE